MAPAGFLRSIGKTLALSVLVVAASSVTADAQRMSESRVGVVVAPFATDAELAQQAATRKEPALAGVLSWIIPGVGSFYAGNSRHGTIHLGIGIVSFVMMIAGAASAVETYNFSTGEYEGGGGAGLMVVGYLAYVVNDIWSIFTAVFDAQKANAGTSSGGGRVVGELQLAPELRGVGSTISLPEAGVNGTRLGLQLFKLQY
jgi:hypothetical protein